MSHVPSMREMINAYECSVRKPIIKRLHEKPRNRLYDNIKTDVKEDRMWTRYTWLSIDLSYGLF